MKYVWRHFEDSEKKKAEMVFWFDSAVSSLFEFLKHLRGVVFHEKVREWHTKYKWEMYLNLLPGIYFGASYN